VGKRLDNAKALYLQAIRDGDFVAAINAHAGARYTQHSTPVKDGKAGFIEFFGEFVERNPIRDIEIVRGFEDGQYVFLQVVQTLNNGEFRYVTADIFDTDIDGKLIEHWDMIAEMAGDAKMGQHQIAGPTEPSDLGKTEQNKVLVRDFLTDVLKNGERDKLTDYVSGANFTQHGLRAGFESMIYEQVHNVIGCGNFVAAMSKMTLDGTGMAVIDLFRVEDDRIVEHWDVMEEIMPQETWVNSGKF
jgi:predicted SnoaL-like aldol condensation-catalyzing enzyme